MDNMILCSTGTFVTRKNNRNHLLICDVSPYLRCDGFEFMIYGSWYDKLGQITDDLALSGVKIGTVHADKELGERISKKDPCALTLFEKNCEAAKKLNAGLIVLHLWNGVTSDSVLDVNLALLPELNAIAADCGLTLAVENVISTTRDPMTNLAIIHARYPDIKFTFDTKMASFHQQLDLLYTPEYAWLFDEDRVKHVHVSDYAGGYMNFDDLRCLQLGCGVTDFDTFFDFLREKHYAGAITLEATASNDDGSVGIERLNASLDKIRKYMS